MFGGLHASEQLHVDPLQDMSALPVQSRLPLLDVDGLHHLPLLVSNLTVNDFHPIKNLFGLLGNPPHVLLSQTLDSSMQLSLCTLSFSH